MLRVWQSECVDKALEKYRSGQHHFFCQATPGGGKTIMAAELAKRLLDCGEIDLVLCFSPSLVVSENMRATFAWRLNCVFNGGLGAVGGSYTYQGLKFLSSSFWKSIKKHRVLAVFDEIHHCSSDGEGRANAWGEQIVKNIQTSVKYTLALTGTPWRSDSVPIAMASYTDPEGQIVCDYQYSLRQAIKDNVCRSPQIVLVDNDNLTISEGMEKRSFSSILELLKQSKTSYQEVIHNRKVLQYVLSLACQKLASIREDNPNAGGLIVAASVKHAEFIQRLLAEEFHQTTTLVTYQHELPLQTIDRFRHDGSEWIISVGMISEGTDIPRLQVCCHLSAVKTELYFRQVLGRILRINNADNQQAWLYTFAEENLIGFAERIEQDIPECCQFARFGDVQFEDDNFGSERKSGFSDAINHPFQRNNLNVSWGRSEQNVSPSEWWSGSEEQLLLGAFKQRVIAAFV